MYRGTQGLPAFCFWFRWWLAGLVKLYVPSKLIVAADAAATAANIRRNQLRDRLFCQLPDTVLRSSSNILRPAGGAYRRRIADRVAAREGRKYSTMEGAGQRSKG